MASRLRRAVSAVHQEKRLRKTPTGTPYDILYGVGKQPASSSNDETF
ncbi:hypothetical protein PtrV1_07484 [Pyrenophora tritici-repentis]|uniref:Uncharacterized protein n=1 Tax=Pyrenophora tritici-repentis TaxID=45151 RepID=A0A5M9LAG4_9PLEO|nr:hypothetical protein PtrV1_07484 [Pyrenophora tritici-repentis]KAF7572270.1 hypothetical protein PtrM4_097700 [Pyrenophora tritici-repentis]KAI0582487.1 hypothetical protein Alg215_04113 [Pyrenophora tritici-repentis]KAI1670570.1 hypothetical protein L13192_06086 [Pyrenophora tritici-repentis]KAI1682194.1 hypothetical protein KJE20_09065 [Pyrenophora tritici-repentis]